MEKKRVQDEKKRVQDFKRLILKEKYFKYLNLWQSIKEKNVYFYKKMNFPSFLKNVTSGFFFI